MMTRLALLLVCLLPVLGCPTPGGDDDDTAGDDDDATADLDGDGYGADDCDDANALIHPGADELCNELDDDCDGAVDEEPVDGNTYYLDEDGDGFYGQEIVACELPSGAGFASNDCDDEDAAVHPGADELCNGADEDCDGVPASDEVDSDGDSYMACAECDDTDPAISPDAVEACDGEDNDCDGTVDQGVGFAPDVDVDGYGDAAGTVVQGDCGNPPAGHAAPATDCNDGDAAIHPGAQEVCDAADTDEDCDALADDADPSVDVTSQQTWNVDSDGDGFGAPVTLCDEPSGTVADGTDCDDTSALANPSIADETCADGLDNNCDGSAAGCGPSGVMLLANADARLLGEQAGDRAGAAIASAGDVNNDGNADLLIGAPDSTAGGAAYVVLGPVSGDVDLSAAHAKLTGIGNLDFAGSAVASAGGHNADGLDDVLVGAYERGQSGAAYLVLSPVSGVVSLSTAAATFTGESDDDWAGHSVAGAGDINNDGSPDVIVGAPRVSTEQGIAYVNHGPCSGDIDLDDNLVTLIGEEDDDWSSKALAYAGDVNGDGIDDLVISAHLNSQNGNESGAAYLVLGSPSGNVDLSLAEAKLKGEGPSHQAGNAVAGAGDVNGDGYADLLVGAQDADRAYVVYGPVSGNTPLDVAGFTIMGAQTGDRAGAAVAGAGDVNGDGFDDLLIGAPPS